MRERLRVEPQDLRQFSVDDEPERPLEDDREARLLREIPLGGHHGRPASSRSTCSSNLVAHTAPAPAARPGPARPQPSSRRSCSGRSAAGVSSRHPDAARAGRHQEHGLGQYLLLVPRSTGASAAFCFGSIRTTVPSFPPATQTEPKPNAMSVTSVPRPPIVLTTCFVFGSIRSTVSSSALTTHTAPAPIAIETGRPPMGTSALIRPSRGSTTATEFARRRRRPSRR